MAFKDYSLNPSENTLLGDGTYIGPNMLRNKVRPALQQIAADGRDVYDELIGEIAAIPAGPPGDVGRVANRTALAALVGTESNTTRFLSESGREGLFVFDDSDLSAKVTSDPEQGVYVPPATATSGVSGAWVRQIEGPVNAKWFGATADGTTNDGAAVQAAVEFIRANATAILNWGGLRLYFPASPAKYMMGNHTLDLFTGLILEGDSGGAAGGSASILHWDDATGIRVQRFNTSGDTSYDAVSHNGGDGAIIRNLTLEGNGTNTGPNADYHGIQLRARAVIENVSIYNFKGDGIHIYAVSGAAGAGEGNANNFRIYNCKAQGCRHGVFVDGPDSNAGTIIGFDGTANRRWGILDSSFLGNTYVGCHADANALFDGGKAVAAHGGNLYTVVHGQEAGASTNAPSGTTAHNTWWNYLSAGVAAAGYGRRQWVTAMTWESGGAYCTDDPNAANVFNGCYSESGQAPSQFTYPTVVEGGLHAAGAVRLGYGTTYGGFLDAASGDGLRALRDFLVNKDLYVNGTSNITGQSNLNGAALITGNLTQTGGNVDFRAPTNSIGPQSGTTDLTVNLNNTSTTCQMNFMRSGVSDGYLASVNGTVYLNGTTAVKLRRNGADIATIDANGMDLASGKTLRVNSVQVVAARKTGWATATGTATRTTFDTTTVTLQQLAERVKALIDDLHGTAGHGLIGT